MTLGISMVVKNEVSRLDACLNNIFDLFDEITVVDTGSTDGTQEKLRSQFNAHVLQPDVSTVEPGMITDARNLSLDKNTCDWVLVIDADEVISRDDVLKIKKRVSEPESAHFLTWRNTRGGVVFDDYKLALFRNNLGVKFEGLVHSNPQRSARSLGLDAVLASDIVLNHSLDEVTKSRSARKQRLERYVETSPDWWRYHWFLGYTYFKDNDFERAVPLLRDACNSLSKDFPVECLNAHIVLTDINARKGIHDKCFRIMKQAALFYQDVQDDFEVKANLQLGPWIASAVELINQNKLDEVFSYEFAF